MGNPTFRFFEITGKTTDCTQTPADPKLDKCRIEVTDIAPKNEERFTLERKGKNYAIAANDLSRITKLYPNFQPPLQELGDYLLAKSEFYRAFGDRENPTDVAKEVRLSVAEKTPLELIGNYTNILSSFIALGEFHPTLPGKKNQLIHALRASIFTYADPVMGPKITEVLGAMGKIPGLSAAAKERVNWLLEIQVAFNQLFSHIQPALEKSGNDLNSSLKSSASVMIQFLFANYLLEEQGEKAAFADPIYETGKAFYDQMSRVEAGQKFGDFYEFMRQGIKQIKTPKFPPAMQAEFNKRLAILDRKLSEAAGNNIAYLGNQTPPKAAKESLRHKYGDTGPRLKALEAILKNLEVKDIGGRPNFELDIPAIHQAWKAILAAPLTPESRREHALAMNYLVKQLFERNGKMQVFWQNDFEEMDNFYDTVKRSILSEASKQLDQMVSWVRAQALEIGADLPKEGKPHVPLRKWSLIPELGVAATGTGAALGFHFGAQDPSVKFYGTGGSIILGASGFGAAGGNLLSYGLDVNPKHAWLFDLGGAVIGGLAGGLIYGSTTTPPGGMPTGPDPARRFPVDPYGP